MKSSICARCTVAANQPVRERRNAELVARPQRPSWASGGSPLTCFDLYVLLDIFAAALDGCRSGERRAPTLKETCLKQGIETPCIGPRRADDQLHRPFLADSRELSEPPPGHTAQDPEVSPRSLFDITAGEFFVTEHRHAGIALTPDGITGHRISADVPCKRPVHPESTPKPGFPKPSGINPPGSTTGETSSK